MFFLKLGWNLQNLAPFLFGDGDSRLGRFLGSHSSETLNQTENPTQENSSLFL